MTRIPPEARRAAIHDELVKRGRISISEVSATLGVSEMTIRRDIEFFESDGTVYRISGGAVLKSSRGYESPFTNRVLQSWDAKSAIGRAVADLVPDGVTVALDFGTTALAAAKALHVRRGLTIATASLPVAAELSTNASFDVLLPGGKVKRGEPNVVGSEAEAFFSAHNWDVSLVSVAGLTAANGLTEYNFEDAKIKRPLVTHADRVIVMADAEKIGRVSFAHIADLSRVDTVVTNASPHDPDILAILAAGVEVVFVDHAE